MLHEQKVTLHTLWERKSAFVQQTKMRMLLELFSGVRARWFHTKGLFIFSSIALSLLFFIGGFFLLLSSVAQNVASTLPTQLSLHIVLDESATPEQKSLIEGRIKTSEYTLYSKEDAVKKVSETLKLPIEAVEFLKADNPLPSYYQVFSREDGDLQRIKDDLINLEGVKKIELDESMVTFFGEVSHKASLVSLLIILAVILTEMVFLSLVIMLLCYMYREEVLIQKFFGGFDSRVIAPFLLDGMLLGVVCSVIGSGVVMCCIHFYGNHLDVPLPPVSLIFLVNTIIGLSVGAVASWGATKIFLSSHRGSV